MKTVTVIIGNSDDKLSQVRWSEFVAQCSGRIGELAHVVYFAGGSGASALWQTSAWTFEIKDGQIVQLKNDLATIRHCFEQDSIVWLEGETQLI